MALISSIAQFHSRSYTGLLFLTFCWTSGSWFFRFQACVNPQLADPLAVQLVANDLHRLQILRLHTTMERKLSIIGVFLLALV